MNSIKHLLLVLLLTFTYSTAVLAQDSTLLWKIEGDDLEQPSYLFGTIHLICEEDFVMFDEVIAALESTDTIALEIDLSDPDLQAKMMQHGMLEDGKQLSQYMDEVQQEVLDSFLTKHYGAGLVQFDSMKPFMLTSMVLMATINCEEGVQSYDTYLLSLAMQRDMNLAAVETVEFQARLFDEIPLKDQVDEILKIVDDPAYGSEQFRDLVSSYKSQDIYRMYETILEDEFWAEYKEVLLDSRNLNWIADIRDLVTSGPTFIAVGAGHLAGQNGVINLLEEQLGYTVTPVMLD